MNPQPSRINRYTKIAFAFVVIAGAISSMFWGHALDAPRYNRAWVYLWLLGPAAAVVAVVAGIVGLAAGRERLLAITALLFAFAALAASLIAPFPGNIPLP